MAWIGNTHLVGQFGVLVVLASVGSVAHAQSGSRNDVSDPAQSYAAPQYQAQPRQFTPSTPAPQLSATQPARPYSPNQSLSLPTRPYSSSQHFESGRPGTPCSQQMFRPAAMQSDGAPQFALPVSTQFALPVSTQAFRPTRQFYAHPAYRPSLDHPPFVEPPVCRGFSP